MEHAVFNTQISFLLLGLVLYTRGNINNEFSSVFIFFSFFFGFNFHLLSWSSDFFWGEIYKKWMHILYPQHAWFRKNCHFISNILQYVQFIPDLYRYAKTYMNFKKIQITVVLNLIHYDIYNSYNDSIMIWSKHLRIYLLHKIKI